MDFELPEEYQLAYQSAFEFGQKEIKPHNAEIERSDDFPPWLWKRLAEQGYTGIAIPEEYGGSGGDFMMAALVHPNAASDAKGNQSAAPNRFGIVGRKDSIVFHDIDHTPSHIIVHISF